MSNKLSQLFPSYKTIQMHSKQKSGVHKQLKQVGQTPRRRHTCRQSSSDPVRLHLKTRRHFAACETSVCRVCVGRYVSEVFNQANPPNSTLLNHGTEREINFDQPRRTLIFHPSNQPTVGCLPRFSAIGFIKICIFRWLRVQNYFLTVRLHARWSNRCIRHDFLRFHVIEFFFSSVIELL